LSQTVPSNDEINAMTPSQFQAYETSLRRAAKLQGLMLQKSLVREPQASDYGTYRLVDPYRNTVEYSFSPCCDYGISIENIHAYLLEGRK
jgi:hypothetical protein